MSARTFGARCRRPSVPRHERVRRVEASGERSAGSRPRRAAGRRSAAGRRRARSPAPERTRGAIPGRSRPSGSGAASDAMRPTIRVAQLLVGGVDLRHLARCARDAFRRPRSGRMMFAGEAPPAALIVAALASMSTPRTSNGERFGTTGLYRRPRTLPTELAGFERTMSPSPPARAVRAPRRPGSLDRCRRRRPLCPCRHAVGPRSPPPPLWRRSRSPTDLPSSTGPEPDSRAAGRRVSRRPTSASAYEEIVFPPRAGDLPAWFVPARDGAAGSRRRRSCTAGNRPATGHCRTSSSCTPAGFHCLVFDVRGHGANAGRSRCQSAAGEFGADAAAGLDALLRRPEVTTRRDLRPLDGRGWRDPRRGGRSARGRLVATAAPSDPHQFTRLTFQLAGLPIPDAIAWPLAWLTLRVYLPSARASGGRRQRANRDRALRRAGPARLTGPPTGSCRSSHLTRLATAAGNARRHTAATHRSRCSWCPTARIRGCTRMRGIAEPSRGSSPRRWAALRRPTTRASVRRPSTRGGCRRTRAGLPP